MLEQMDTPQTAVSITAEQSPNTFNQGTVGHLSREKEEVLNKVSEFYDLENSVAHAKNLNFLLNQFLSSDQAQYFSEEAIAEFVESTTTVNMYLFELQEKNSRLVAAK